MNDEFRRRNIEKSNEQKQPETNKLLDILIKIFNVLEKIIYKVLNVIAKH